MIKIRSYWSEISKNNIIDHSGFGQETNIKNNIRIPVIVTDLKTNKSVKYKSISEAARNLAAHPKTIWRKVHNKQPYLGRYMINNVHSRVYRNVINYFVTKHRFLFNNYVVFLYILLNLVLFGYIIYKCAPYLIKLFTDIYNNYINTYEKDVNQLKYVLNQNNINNNIFNYAGISISDKVNGLAEFNQEWRSVCVLKNKNSFINGFSPKAGIGIYQSIINEINLDFHIDTFPALNSSPIVERININNIFSNAIESTRPTISIVDNTSSSNSLIIHTQSLHNNRNFSIVNNGLYGPKSPARELLNYNSNVLYCLINGLSPSTY